MQGSAAFTTLLHALLSRHVFRPQLVYTAFAALLLHLAPSAAQQATLVGETSSSNTPATSAAEAGPSRLASPANAQRHEDSQDGAPSALANAVVDVIWAVDDEIDARKELAATQGLDLLAPGLSEAVGSLDEQATAARTRLADVVRDLLVSATPLLQIGRIPS